MFDEMPERIAFLFEKQRELAETMGEWVYRTLRRITRPSTPVYIPKPPMTQAEQERVSPTDAEDE